MKTTDSGKIDFKPESSLSHHGNTAPKASIFEVSKASAQQTSSSVSSKAGTKGLLEKNKSLNLPLKKILGIEQKTGNVKIANSSRLSKSPNRHKFQAYSLIELDQKSQSDYKNSKGSISPGHTLSDEYGKDFFTGSKESLQKFKEFKKRKDHSGFIYKDTAWMQDKGDDGKIVCPSYSHVYTEKVPAKPIHGRIYTKVTQ